MVSKPNVRFTSGIPEIDRCHDLALETLISNIKPHRDGLLTEPLPCIMAGESYGTPWTRDTAYNVWNAGALLYPEAAKNTLLSTLMRDDDGIRIGGQYWDAIAWVTGAWHYFCVSGDEEFLDTAFEGTANSLDYFERTEFDRATGLFTGPASYGDGVASYPEPYCDAGGSSGILDYPKAHPEVEKILMKCLSTNCLYYSAYRLAVEMADRLGKPERTGEWRGKADALRESIRKGLWMESEGRFAYFLGNEDERIEYMEGLGHSLALLFGVADDGQAKKVLENQYVSPYGIPCVWPIFPRFESEDGMACGRHNGTVWPFIQGFWAEAAARHGRLDLFEKELDGLTRSAGAANNFMEIFHPVTGEPYGGLQIDNGEMRMWGSCPRQTWSATAYLRMLYNVVLGMRIEPEGIGFEPRAPKRFSEVRLDGLPYRGATLDITVRGAGTQVESFLLDGEAADRPWVGGDVAGEHEIEIHTV
jgi:hypothetical protein